ncbi:MAG: ferritin family protein [Syntrophus sp. (in: bacteria)]|nr:ferritin family protein [Syntrophus sp. (in: bacteria)]
MESEVYKKILNMAIEREIEAATFYQDVCDKTVDGNLKTIFGHLAAEERGHRALLEGFLTDESRTMKFKSGPDYKVSETVERPSLSMEMKPVDAIALAMKKEEDAMNMYFGFSRASDDEGQREIFDNLASMEQSHKAKLEDLYTNMAFPEVW